MLNKNERFKRIFRTLTDSTALKWIAKSSKGQIWFIVLMAAINIILACSSIVVSYLLRFVVNSATDGTVLLSERLSNITYWGVFFGLTIILQALFRMLENHLVFRVTARLTINIKSKLFRTILGKQYGQVTKYHTGEMLNRLNNDIGVITSAITSLIPNLVFTITKLIGIFFVLLSIDPWFTLVFIGVALFVFLVSAVFKKAMKKYHKQIMETDGKTRSFMQEVLSSLLVIKIFNVEDKVTNIAGDLQEINYKRKARRNIFSVITHGSFSLAFNAAYLFGLFYCAVKIAHGDAVITYGVLSQVLNLISQIRVPINSMTSFLPTYYSAIGSAERIMEFEDMNDEVIVNDDNIDSDSIYNNLKTIEFNDITFKYDRELIFNNTSLSINKGDLIVMTGISGIGKSTLLKLLLDVFNVESGEIYLNMNDGSKIAIDRNMRRLFSYVPQGNFLLSGTIRENISFINDGATDEEIWEAVDFACADFIRELPQGLDTIIGEKGMGLSEGQVQRVAIARAFLSGSPVILLDEATSALDETTEIRLLHNIKKLSNKTCILISHKKAANEMCNKEIRIVDGKIVVYELGEKS